MLTLINMVKSFMNHPRLAWTRTEEGQTTIEYILVIVLIALVIVFAFQSSAINNAIDSAVTKIADAINNAPTGP